MMQIRILQQGHLVTSLVTDRKLIRLGRGPNVDIELDDPLISAEHLVLREKDSAWYLEDVSRNGLRNEKDEVLPQIQKISKSLRLKVGRLYQVEIHPHFSPLRVVKEKTLIGEGSATRILSVSKQKAVLGRAWLSYRDLHQEERKIQLGTSGVSLGSHPANDIVLPSSAVSQFHAEIRFNQSDFILRDLGSTNGTFADGNRIFEMSLTQKTPLRLGDTELTFLLETETRELETRSSDRFMGITSRSAKMKRAFALAEVAAQTMSPVFISGESGTGKELMARALHQLSPRYEGPFLPLNCAALPRELLESELFGHEKGSFSGAINHREGAFEAAHNGSLFLDEIADLDLSLQAKLLRVLENGEVKRVGANETKRVSVRLISASHKNLQREVAAGRFREDLFYRLHVIQIELTPLRERLEDLDLLVSEILEQIGSPLRPSPEALEALKTYSFPGNVRELRNILQRAHLEYQVQLDARKEPGVLMPAHLHFLKELKSFKGARTGDEKAELSELQSLMSAHGFNQSSVARELGIPVSTLHDKLRRYGIARK